MNYLKSKTALWPELILMVLVQLRLAEAHALAASVAAPPPPRPKGSAPSALPPVDPSLRQSRIAPSGRRLPATVQASPAPRRRQAAIDADVQSRPLIAERPGARPRRASRVPLAAASSDARLPGSAAPVAARAEASPSSVLALMPETRSQAGPQRLMAPPPPPRPTAWALAGGSEAVVDGNAAEPMAATPAAAPDSSANPESPAAIDTLATRGLLPAPAALTLRPTAALSRRAAALPRALTAARAGGEAGLARSDPAAATAASRQQDPSLAAPIVIIPVRMLPPSGDGSGGIELAGATVVLPPGVSLQQALGLKLPAAESSGAAAAEPAGRPVVIRLGDAAGAAITAAVNAARLVGASGSLTLADGASAPQTPPGASEELARLCGASGSSLLAGGSAAGSIPVNGGRLFWIGTAGQSVGDSAWGEDEDGSEAAAAGNRNDTIVFWFTPDSADANGPGDSGDWISDLSALGDAADRITDADACGDPSGGSGSDPLLATMVEGLSAAAASGGGLFLAVHDPAAGSAGGQALFVQINSLADLASLAVPTAGDPLA